MQEPRLHTALTDVIPDDHPWAWKSVFCVWCGQMVHGIPNECMDNWAETGLGPLCLSCLVESLNSYDDDDRLLLPDDYVPSAEPPEVGSSQRIIRAS